MARRGEWTEDLIAGLAGYCLTSLPVLIGVLFGIDFVSEPEDGNAELFANVVTACSRINGRDYTRIIRDGYSFNPRQCSAVAFFPAYPLLSRGLWAVSGLSPEASALLVAHAALAAAFILMARYTRARWPEASAQQRSLVLAAFGLWPATLFFRMAYAESLFVCATLAMLLGMARRHPMLPLAILTGFVTAIRPVGVAATVVLAFHLLNRPAKSVAVRVLYLVGLIPVACWGLLAYMSYQAIAFGDPLAFVVAHEQCKLMEPGPGSQAKLWSLMTLEPAWGLYIPGYSRYWANLDRHGNPAFSMMFWNPILFSAAAAMLICGARTRWLNKHELLLGVGLLGIPYVTRSYEMSMGAHARFAAVVVINYLVLGRLLARAPALLTSAFCAVCATLLCVWTALFAAGRPIF
jgi:hypothetical protein